MPIIQPNFTEATDVLPAGTYKAQITGAEIKTSKTSGNPYVNWTLVVVDNENPGLNGQKIWHTTPTVGKGAGILRSFIRAATGEVPTGAFDTEMLYGRQVNVVTGLKDGSAYPEVKAVKSL